MDTYKTDGISLVHNITRQHTSPFHRHNGYELYLFLEGKVNFYIEQSGFELGRGYLLPIKPGSWHRAMTLNDSDYERIYINFSVEFGRSIVSAKTDLLVAFKKGTKSYQPVVELAEEQIQEAIKLARELQDALEYREFGYDLKIRALLIQLLLMLYDTRKKTPKIKEEQLPRLILDILFFIDSNLDRDLSIDRFSAEFYRDGPYLSRYFKKIMGVTLQDYIISKRIELAKEILGEGKSVEEVCEKVGFGNYYHFIRAFKQRTGTSPGQYKKEKIMSQAKPWGCK